MTQSRACIMYNNIRGMDGRGWGVGDGLVSRACLSLEPRLTFGGRGKVPLPPKVSLGSRLGLSMKGGK